MSKLIEFNQKGIYCTVGDFYIDPNVKVETAVITHAHSDHARRGSLKYISHKYTKPLIESRINAKNVIPYDYGEEFEINGVKVSLFPSGHVIGGAQVKIEHDGEVVVITSDFKTEDDGISGKFIPIKCDTLVMESTFAQPIYKWDPQEMVYSDMNEWWKTNKVLGRASVIFCYSLGKAQRILANIDPEIGPIVVDDSIDNMNQIIRDMGLKLPITQDIRSLSINEKKEALILTSSYSLKNGWLNQAKPYALAEASGWMKIDRFRRGYIDRGFVLSDHADWDSLNQVVKDTEAKEVYVMHGFTKQFAAWLNKNGIKAQEAYSTDKIKNPDQLSLGLGTI